MKKVKYIALALVLCLGLIGGAYAWWTDTLEIDGTVETGHMEVKWESFYIRNEGSGHHTYAVLPEYSNVEAKIDPDDPTGRTALIKIENLYPRGPMADAPSSQIDWPLEDVVGVSGIMKNYSSIPVKFSGADINITDSDGIASHLKVITRLGHRPAGSSWYEIAHTGTPGVPLSELASWITEKLNDWDGTLKTGDTLSFGDDTMYFYLVGDAPQNSGVNFTMELNFTQWNAP